MPSKKKKMRRKGIKTLDFFLDRKSREKTKDHMSKNESRSEGKDDLEALFNELFKSAQISIDKTHTDLATVEFSPGESRQDYTEKEPITRQKTGISRKIALSKALIPEGPILHKILEKPIRTINEIMCDNNGLCRDNRKLSEIFVDEYGFKRQRGFVRTTRAPIFLDWIVEEAIVSKILPTAYKVETSRGAVALVPESFLCELDKRYGVLLKNYDCRNYKLSISSSEKRKK